MNPPGRIDERLRPHLERLAPVAGRLGFPPPVEDSSSAEFLRPDGWRLVLAGERYGDQLDAFYIAPTDRAGPPSQRREYDIHRLMDVFADQDGEPEGPRTFESAVSLLERHGTRVFDEGGYRARYLEFAHPSAAICEQVAAQITDEPRSSEEIARVIGQPAGVVRSAAQTLEWPKEGARRAEILPGWLLVTPAAMRRAEKQAAALLSEGAAAVADLVLRSEGPPPLARAALDNLFYTGAATLRDGRLEPREDIDRYRLQTIYRLEDDAEQQTVLRRQPSAPGAPIAGTDAWWAAVRSGVIQVSTLEGVVDPLAMTGEFDRLSIEVIDADGATSRWPALGTGCYAPGASIEIDYVLQPALAPSPWERLTRRAARESRIVLEVRLQTTRDWVLFSTFANLFASLEGRRMVMPRLRDWYGVQFSSLEEPYIYITSEGAEIDTEGHAAQPFDLIEDKGLRVRAPGGGEIALFPLHRRIEADPEQREDLYQAYMNLAR